MSTDATTQPDDQLALLLAGIDRELPAAVALRQRLHADPELAHHEHRTAAAVAAELPVPCTAVAGTGLIAQIGGPRARASIQIGSPPARAEADKGIGDGSAGAGPIAIRGDGSAGPGPIAIRAELDGLPVAERTGAPFSANGEEMHACGHDIHMAALVALARAVHGLGESLPAPLLAIFQPSEEAYPSGAQQIAAALAGPSPPVPKPAAVLAAHVHPELPWNTVALDPGPVNASCDYVTIEVRGEPAHGAYPHLGRDPILALAEVVVSLHAQVGRRIDPLHPATLTVGVIEGGSAENVIPALARARAALRAYRPEDRRALRALVGQVVTGVATAHGCLADVALSPGEPALDNDPAIVARARALLPAAGFKLAPEWRSCGSDDFAFFAASNTPLAMAFVGLDGAPGFTTRPLHHPELLPPDEAVGAAARTLAALYVAAASSG
ncbi:MAG TPA: amidohydrolase [Solirubrobacteraceae bacterium]|nr:amidohydrolase [Solirubrobacteraceae bacterium]